MRHLTDTILPVIVKESSRQSGCEPTAEIARKILSAPLTIPRAG
jgi:hypothetical protein